MHFFATFAAHCKDTISAMNHTRQYTLQHIPFLRLLLPLVAGIAWQHASPSLYIIYVWGAIAIGSMVAAWFTRNNTLSKSYQYTFTLSVAFIMIAAGMIGYRCHTAHAELPHIESKSVAIARISTPPHESNYTYSTQAVIVALQDSTTIHETEIPIVLNIQKSFSASQLTGGDLIVFTPNLQSIEPPTLPHAYDYARQMALKGILYRQYLSDGEWQPTTYTTQLSLLDHARRVQLQCVHSLQECGVSPDNASLLAALLWGYKEDIPEEIRGDFSTAGLSHVLAVSGLHTGIIAFILWILLWWLRYTRFRKLQHLLTMAALWVYAFITGLSPSVTRACMMATFIGVAHLIERRNTSLNALCGSAVIILLVSPMQLFDVGFQLSYTAVAGIILFSPYFDLSQYIDKPHETLRYATGIVAVSLAAQVATLPLAAYYFHYIPVWGLLSNIIIVPLLPLVVTTALCMQLLHTCHLPHSLLSSMTDGLAHAVTQVANSIAQLPGASIPDVWITPLMLILYFIITLSVWYMLSRQTLRPSIIALGAVILLQIINITTHCTPSKPQAIVPQEREYTTLQLSDKNHNCHIVTTNPSGKPPHSGMEWRISQHLTTHITAANDTVCNCNIYIALPFIRYFDTTLLWVNDNTWRYTHSSTLYQADYAIITETYKGKISQLQKSFDIRNIILSASIFPQRADELRAECEKAGITYYDIGQENTWIMGIKEIKKMNFCHYE